jgi:hypothetical protein
MSSYLIFKGGTQKKNISNPSLFRRPTDEAASFLPLGLSAVGVPLLHPHPATTPTAGVPRPDGGLPAAGTSIPLLQRRPVAAAVDPGWEGKSYLEL